MRSTMKGMPFDPVTRSDETWIVDYADLGDEDISLEPGVKDLHSGAPGAADDGTPYGDW